MSVKIIFPYIKRLARSRPKLKACVFEHKNTIKNELTSSSLFEEVGDDPENADLVVFGYKNLEKSTLAASDFWSKMNPNGWVVLIDHNRNIDLVTEFRKGKKITSLFSRVEGIMFFQKETYEERDSKTKQQLDQLVNSFAVDETEIIEVPDWQGSHLKEEYIHKYSNGKTFVETGTYRGQTVELVRRTRKFEKIISIELNDELWSKADKYFKSEPHIDIRHGDSVDHMVKICEALKEADEPATFWLDAHASGPLSGGKTGPSPLVQELEAIRDTGRNDHTIFIDDLRLFGSPEWDYLDSSTIYKLLKEINPDYKLRYLDGEKEKDVLCATVVENEWKGEEENNELDPKLMDFFNALPKKKEEEPKKPKLIFLE